MGFSKWRKNWPPTPLIVVSIMLTAASGMASFVGSAYNIAESAISNFLTASSINTTSSSTIEWSLAQSLESIGAAVGMLFFVQVFIDGFGRKMALIIQMIGACGSFTLQGMAKYVYATELLYIGRFLEGLFVSTMLVTLPVFFSEVSTSESRGCLSSSLSFVSKALYVLGCVAGMPEVLGTVDNWPWIAWISLIVTFAMLLLFLPSPESPKYLYLSKNDDANASRSLHFYHVDRADSVAARGEWDAEGRDGTGKFSWWPNFSVLFTEKRLRGSLIFCIIVSFSWCATAASALNSVSSSILSNMGLGKLPATITIMIMYALSGITGAFCARYVDSRGRRPLALVSSMFNAIVWILLFLVNLFSVKHSPGNLGTSVAVNSIMMPILSAVCIVLLRVSASGIAILFYAIIPEYYPFYARSKAKTFFAFVCFTIDFVVTLFFLQLVNKMGPFAYAMFGVIQFACFGFYYKFCYETKQMPIHLILDMVNKNFRVVEVVGETEEEDEKDETSPLLMDATAVGPAMS